MPRYSVGAEFIINADTMDDARTVVGNFCDSFPSEVDADADADVIVQDASEVD